MSCSQMRHCLNHLCQGIDLFDYWFHFSAFDHLSTNIQIRAFELGDKEHDLLACAQRRCFHFEDPCQRTENLISLGCANQNKN